MQAPARTAAGSARVAAAVGVGAEEAVATRHTARPPAPRTMRAVTRSTTTHPRPCLGVTGGRGLAGCGASMVNSDIAYS